jgi:hypothetical protein
MTKRYFSPEGFIYIMECIIGLCICYTLYKVFPQHQFYWSMVSVLLVIAPDGKNSNRLAFDRMKANVLGSGAPKLKLIEYFGIPITDSSSKTKEWYLLPCIIKANSTG